MHIPFEIYRRAGKTTVQTKAYDIVNQYMAIDHTNKFMCIRIGFAWMYPKEEDPMHRTYRVGINAYSSPSRQTGWRPHVAQIIHQALLL
jgi:hypothetical protein